MQSLDISTRRGTMIVMLLGVALAGRSPAQVFTINIPRPAPATSVTNLLVAHGDEWHWRRGTNAPQPDWSTAAEASLDASWRVAPGGFGFGDDAIVGEATRVDPGMANIHTTLYIRRTVQTTDAIDTNANLVFTVDYDDGFVAYLDGVECARRNVPGTPGTPVFNTNTTGGVSHEASCCQSPNPPTVINLGLAGNWLPAGPHVLALIGVNQSISSSDFHLIADLATVRTTPGTNAGPLVTHGLYALAATNQVLLNGSNTIPGGVRVTVNGDDAAFDSAQGRWSRVVALQPGWNPFYLAVHDIYGSILTNIEQAIVYEAGALRAGGTLTGATVWNDPSTVIYVSDNVEVTSGARLTIGAGTVVILSRGLSITATARGVINIQGADERHVMFLPADTNAWGWLMATGTNAQLQVRQGEVVAGQVRVENGGELLMEDGIIRDLPDVGVEVVKGVSGVGLTLRRTYLTRFAEADSLNTPVLVDGCLLEGFLVDGVDIKASNLPLIVRRSTFRSADPNNSNADAVDFGPGAGTVESCLIHDFPDKGVSIGGAPGTLIRNSLIYRCGIGVSAYASTGVVIENSTISSCLNGILFRDNPTRAVGSATNLVVWGNTTNVAVLNTSVLGLSFSDVQNTNYPGTGNISADPRFVALGEDDYRLSAGSPALGAADDGGPMGVRFPVGGIPSAPARLVALARGNDLVQLYWTDTAENENGVLIERSPDRVVWQFVANAPANATVFTVVEPVAQEPIYYRVRATNDVGVSQFSNPARATTAAALALAIAQPAPGQIVLEFPASAGKSYVLQACSTLSAASWTNLTTIAAPTSGVCRITNELAGTGRFFRLMMR